MKKIIEIIVDGLEELIDALGYWCNKNKNRIWSGFFIYLYF